MQLFAGQRHTQLIGQHTIVSRATGNALALVHAPQVYVADSAVDDLSLYDFFIDMIIATLLLQFANHASHNASRP